MNKHSRDQSIYGHHLMPFALLLKEKDDPMQHIKDLENDLKFSTDQGENYAVITSQKTVKAVLADLAALRTQLKDMTDQFFAGAPQLSKANARAEKYHKFSEQFSMAFNDAKAALLRAEAQLATHPSDEGGELRGAVFYAVSREFQGAYADTVTDRIMAQLSVRCAAQVSEEAVRACAERIIMALRVGNLLKDRPVDGENPEAVLMETIIQALK